MKKEDAWLLDCAEVRAIIMLLGRTSPLLPTFEHSFKREAGDDWRFVVDTLVDLGYVETADRGWRLKRPEGEPLYDQIFKEHFRAKKEDDPRRPVVGGDV